MDKSGIRHYNCTPDGNRIQELGKIILRMVRVDMDSVTHEVLATNLSEELFSNEDISALYHLRWGYDTVYETLKSRF